jgi:hypothetical protein
VSTEKDLAVSHPGFWRTTLPLVEPFIRTLNRTLERYDPPMYSTISADRRGLVNEAAFRAFVFSVKAGKRVAEIHRADLEAAWAGAAAHVRTMRQFSRSPIDPTPGSGELDEVLALAHRTAVFFANESIVLEPRFRGCGWLDESTGDVLAGKTLFEIKAGDRHFRSVDLYQLLTYCALNFVSKSLVITDVGLINPRVGVFAVLDLDDLCDQCAGASAAEVLDEIARYVSERLGASGS